MITMDELLDAAAVFARYVREHGTESHNGVAVSTVVDGESWDVHANRAGRFTLLDTLANLQNELLDIRDGIEVTLGHAADILIDECLAMQAPNFRAHTINRGGEAWEIIVRKPDSLTVDEVLRDLRHQVEELRENTNEQNG